MLFDAREGKEPSICRDVSKAALNSCTRILGLYGGVMNNALVITFCNQNLKFSCLTLMMDLQLGNATHALKTQIDQIQKDNTL